MAVTSGSCSASHSYITETLSWWQTGQSIEGNYTDIGWSLVLSRTYSISSSQSKAYSVNIDGQVWSGSTSISGSGSKTVASGTKRIYHNSDGSRSFSFSFSQTFGINYNGYLSSLSSSGSSELYTIPRQANITNSPSSFTDEDNPWFDFTNSANASLSCWLEPNPNGDHLCERTLSGTSGRYTWSLTEEERKQLRAKCTSNSCTVRIGLYSKIGSSTYASYVDRTMTIVNGNPTFSNFTYKDTNTTVTAITGNDQVLVKGISNLQATISSANKMVAQKEATAKNYVATIDTTNISKDYSTSDIVFDLGTVSSSGTKRLNIRAYDSRNNSTLVYKDITFYDYSKPVLNVSATRLNNFEDTTTLSVNGSFSSLLIGGTEKNALGKVEYRYRQSGGEWGSWTELTTTLTDNTFKCTDIVLKLDNTNAFDFEVRVTDNLSTTTKSASVDIGKSIFFISSNKKACYINGQEILQYEIVDEW